MKNILILFFLISQFSYGQYRVDFKSFPDSVAVYKNGVEQCYTPCRVKYYWSERVDNKVIFELKKEGYETWAKDIFAKPLDFDDAHVINLEKDYASRDLENTPIIGFDKIILNFDEQDTIGSIDYLDGTIEDMYWSGSINVGDPKYSKKFYKVTSKMGFNNVVSESNKLFSDNTSKKLPKYVIGAEVLDCNTKYNEEKKKRNNNGNMLGKSTMDIGWHVLNKKTGKEVLFIKNSASIKFREFFPDYYYYMDVFELALIDFLNQDEFIQLLKDGSEEDDDREDISKTKIEEVQLGSFNSMAELIKLINPACVTVSTDIGHGSGVIISKKGLMLTAYHVIENAHIIDVIFSSGISLRARLIKYDELNDIALLDIMGEGFTAIPMIEENEYKIGSEIFTIGTPAELDLGQSVSRGIVSGNRKIENRHYLQLDLAVSPGNSGGPIINEQGKIIGIVQNKIIGGGIEGIGFGIPIDLVREVLFISNK